MSTPFPKCPLCGDNADFFIDTLIETAEDAFRGRCQQCGDVRVMRRVVNDLQQEKRLHLLSAFFRRTISRPPLVTSDNVNELLSAMPVLRTVPEKMNGLLRLLVETNRPPGSPIDFDPNKDYPRVFAVNWEEAFYLLQQLERRRFVERKGTSDLRQVTAEGYERYEELEAASYKAMRNAFVAMSFDKSREAIYNEAIKPAIDRAGYNAVRIDKVDHVNRIDDEIIAQLRQSRFQVADFTGQRAGVYFEAGFMLGLGRNVFWMCERSELGKVHSDTRQYNFIDYGSVEDAESRLYFRILAIEGLGPLIEPNG